MSRREFLSLTGCLIAGGSAYGGALVAAGGEPREAAFWESLAGNRVRCGLCPHHCVIADGRRGIRRGDQ